jgi:hypothetical protein
VRRDFPHPSIQALRSIQPPVQWYGFSFPAVKRPGRGVDQPPSSGAQVKEGVELCIYFLPGSFWPVLGAKLYFPDPAVSAEFLTGHVLNTSNAYSFSQVGRYKERSTDVLLVYALNNPTKEIYSVIVFVINFVFFWWHRHVTHSTQPGR